MTTDNAIAVLRRMQEPDPFEPQITQTTFDALEMAIDMIERYSTWSQTYSNMVEDAISRQAAVDVIHKYFAERIEQSPTHMTEDGEVYDLGICNPLLADNKALSQAIKELPSVQSEHATCYLDSPCEYQNINIALPSAQPEWIPVKTRPMTDEERNYWSKHYGYDVEYEDAVMFDCKMPEDGQEILVSYRKWISMDKCEIDGGCYGLEGNGDWEDVIAWMPLPEPYKEKDNEKA